ncbi:MAG: hypothetical protein EBR02_08400 [Alphaproteobacteria bacterium]|nr:hypothetical protein [Alphaproteobacteria bacterium]
MLTPNSHALFDRVAGYDVLGCLPKKTEYISEQQAGSYTLVRAKTQLGNTPRFLKLAFTGGKLDIPYSLRMALGESWEKQVNATEQIYLMLRAQFGGKLNCNTVQGLVSSGRTDVIR